MIPAEHDEAEKGGSLSLPGVQRSSKNHDQEGVERRGNHVPGKAYRCISGLTVCEKVNQEVRKCPRRTQDEVDKRGKVIQ